MSYERGFTVLLLLLVLAVGATSLFLGGVDIGSSRRAVAATESARSASHAVEALTAYALADGYRNPSGSTPDPDDIRPGSLPCPDGDADGSADLFAGNDCPAYVALLPNRTLDAKPFRDSRGHPLWYALDPAFRDHEDAEPINPTINPPSGGSLTIDGTPGFVAVVIAPGPPLERREDPLPSNIGQYLERDNADGDLDFTSCVGLDQCNDRVIGIRVDDLMDPVQERVLGEVRELLDQYYKNTGPAGSRHLPDAAPFGETVCDDGRNYGQLPTSSGAGCSVAELDTSNLPRWINDNDWLDIVYYHVHAECLDGGSSCSGANLMLGGNSGLDVVLGGAGRALSGQVRGTGATVDDYLDAPKNQDDPPDGEYAEFAITDTQNDAFLGVEVRLP